jgi:hypothetical protein
MSQGLYTFVTRASGTVLTAAIYNSDHQNHVVNQNPQMTGGYSDDVAQMQSVWNPGVLGSEDLATSLAGEIERLRYQLRSITGESQWYIQPAINLKGLSGGGQIPLSSLQNAAQGSLITRLGTGTGPVAYSLLTALTALAPVAGDLVLGVPAAGGALRKIDITNINGVPATGQGAIPMRLSTGAGPFEQSTITSLTALTPVSADLLLGVPSGGGAPRKITAGDLAALATAAASAAPQGRLTLQSFTPVMTATLTAQGNVIYTPYRGLMVPNYDGANVVMKSTGGELSQLLTDATKSPAAAIAAKNYDIFFWMDGATPRISRGPPWTSDTARGTGAGTTELQRPAFGILVNAQAITNGPAAWRGTYLGTIRTNAGSASIDWNLGGASVAGNLGIWNAYNRVRVCSTTTDASAAYAYTTAAWRAANNSVNNRCNFVVGLQEEAWESSWAAVLGVVPGVATMIGIGLDTTTAVVLPAAYGSLTGGTAVFYQLTAKVAQQITAGFHFFSGIEFGAAGCTFNNSTSPGGLVTLGSA